MPDLVESDVVTRAKQLFEIESGRQWEGTAPGGGAPASDSEKASYMEKARQELQFVEEEGHS